MLRINILNNDSGTRTKAQSRNSESGFTLLEMVTAMMIMLIGLLALASAIGFAFMVSNKGRNITNTKLLVTSVLEHMETLRNTKQLTFDQISNVGSVDNTGAARPFTGFSTDFQPISPNPGPDGIICTGDDFIEPGADGLYGTNDDVNNQSLAPAGYSRRVIITRLSASMKRIEVTLRYPGDVGDTQTRVGVSYLNDDARGNFRP